jgi:glycosyltransferase involved in cell wall biosynthesis
MPQSDSSLISIIIPAFNEGRILGYTINAIKKALSPCENYEIIVVDDGSTDDTAIIAERAGAKVIKHERNLGYGKALLTGFTQAKGDIIVIIEANPAFNPLDIKKLVKEIGKADLVVGSRFLLPSKVSLKIPYYEILKNKIRALITYFLTGVKVTDHDSSFRAIRKDKLDQIRLTSTDFSINTEMVVKAAKKGFKISEVPVLYQKWRRL